jgi:hypothetical protein
MKTGLRLLDQWSLFLTIVRWIGGRTLRIGFFSFKLAPQTPDLRELRGERADPHEKKRDGFIMTGPLVCDDCPIQENGEMKSTMFVLLAMFVSTPQPSSVLQEEPDIAIQNFEWGIPRATTFRQPVDYTAERSGRPEERLPGESIPRSEMDPRNGRRGATTAQVVTRNETYALVKNVGTKTTKVVEWEYIFFSDTDYQKELKRYKFRNKIKIAPGETKFLSKDVDDKAFSIRQKVHVVRIEYTDNSVWQRAKSKSEP